jgi:hypothetical protein
VAPTLLFTLGRLVENEHSEKGIAMEVLIALTWLLCDKPTPSTIRRYLQCFEMSPIACSRANLSALDFLYQLHTHLDALVVFPLLTFSRPAYPGSRTGSLVELKEACA